VLFSLETRQLFFSCTAFGVSRTIAWIQKERDAALAATGTSAAGEVELHAVGESPMLKLPHSRMPPGVACAAWLWLLLSTLHSFSSP
jgi:E3 ubiquitin-protein ligase HECTD1